MTTLHSRLCGIFAGADAAIVGALVLLAAAVWLPPLTLQRPIVSAMVTFDITQSMDVEDVDWDGAPVSRLAAARAAMRATLRQLPCGSKLGWAVFADYRTLPLTLPVEVCSHYEDLLASLDRIDGRMRWADASNIGKGVTWTVRTARSIAADVNVVFFTDGHEAPPLRELDEVPPLGDIRPGEVAGWLIGVGGALPARIPKTDRDGNRAGFWAADEVMQRTGPAPGSGHEHLSELREGHLRALAKLVGFEYQQLSSPAALTAAMLDARMTRPQPVATDQRWIPALLALLLLAWRFAPERARRAGQTALSRSRNSLELTRAVQLTRFSIRTPTASATSIPSTPADMMPPA